MPKRRPDRGPDACDRLVARSTANGPAPGRSALGGGALGRADCQRRADLDPVARAGGRPDPALGRGGPGPGLGSTVAGQPYGVVRSRPDRVDPRSVVTRKEV